MPLLICVIVLFFSGLVHAVEPVIKGEFIPGAILFGSVQGNPSTETDKSLSRSGLPEVRIDGRRVRLTHSGEFVFGIGRDAKGAVELSLHYSPNEVETYKYSIGTREYNIQKIEGVAKKHVSPPKEVLARIARERDLVKAARALDDARADFLQPFIWPLIGPITGVYGSQRFYNGVPRSPHYGLDIAAPTGTNVIAPAAGVVTLAEADLYYSGGTLILDHGHGFSSTFIHLHKVLVKVGDKIQQGDAIAQVGASGRATGPHLDWRLNWFHHRLDPALLMQGTPMEPVKKVAAPKGDASN